MPERETARRASEDLRRGKSPSTAAGEFVREEMHHIREGKHGAKSAKQAVAIGLSKARRAGVPLRPPKRGTVKASTRRAASHRALAAQARRSAKARGRRARVAAARKAASTRRRSA